MRKVTTATVLSILLLESASLNAGELDVSGAPDYSNVFNRKIYQQNLNQTPQELIAEKSGNLSPLRKNELDRLCLEQLYENKSKQLEKRISDARNIINIYTRQLNNGPAIIGKIIFSMQALKPLYDVFSKTTPTGFLPLGLEVPDSVTLRTKIALFKNKIEILRRGIDEGYIPGYEKKYVQIKRLLDPNLQAQIEEELIHGYNAKDSYFTLINKKFIDLALALPYRPMQIYNDNIQEEDMKLQKNFNDHPAFKNYPEQLRRSLLEIARKIAFASCDSEKSTVALRGVYYIQGAPACGKSYFCRELASFLGIPFYETTIRSPNDLSTGKPEGNSRYSPQTTPGWFVEALIGDQPSGQGFNNGLLVLNEFDRVMNDPQALVFLLEHLDPAKSTIYLPFLNIKHGFSRLSIILTANSSIPNDKIHEALKSRIPIINFPNFTKEDQIRIVNDGCLTDLLKHYAFPNWIKVKYTENEKLTFMSSVERDRAVYSVDLNQTMTGVDLRVRKEKLDAIFNSASLKTREIANRIYDLAMRLFAHLNGLEPHDVVARYNHMCEAIQELEEVPYDSRVYLGTALREINNQNTRIKSSKEFIANLIAEGNFTPRIIRVINFYQREIIKILSGYQGSSRNPVIMFLTEAANLGLLRAANEIGKVNFNEGRFEESKSWLNLVLAHKEVKGFREPVLEAIQNFKIISQRQNNNQEMLNYVVMAANLGEPESLFELGNKFYAEEEYCLAKRYYHEAAYNGHNEALQKIGKLNLSIQDNTALTTLLNNNFDGLAPLLSSLAVAEIDLSDYSRNFFNALTQMKTLEKVSVLKTTLSNENIVELADVLKGMGSLKEISLSMPYSLSYTTDFVSACSRDLWQDYASPTGKTSTATLVSSYMLLPIASTIISFVDIVTIIDSNGIMMHPARCYGQYFYRAFRSLKETPTLKKVNMHLIGYVDRKDILRETFNAERHIMNLPEVKVDFM